MSKAFIGNNKRVGCKLSDKHKEILRINFTGENNPHWRGGISKFNTNNRYNKKYKEWRISVLERDEYTCKECETKNVVLHTHHLKSYTFYPDYRYDTDNGLTVCVPCHKNKHSKRNNNNQETR